jgi:hypothetical protein
LTVQVAAKAAISAGVIMARLSVGVVSVLLTDPDYVTAPLRPVK